MLSTRLAFTAAVVAALLPGVARADDGLNKVWASAGKLPLILTVPHDGGESLGRLPPRKKGVLVRDTRTRDLAERTASWLEVKTGKRPYLVIALASRKYLDVNRPPEEAMESADALPAYRAYHDQIEAYVRELAAKFPAGAVLVDVHAQAAEPATTFRGTRAGLTVKRLLDRAGTACLQGPKSITGVLASKGYAVHPPVQASSMQEDPRYRGGYTVLHHGSQHPGGIDAIQLEFGGAQRANDRLAEDLAHALATFLSECGFLR